MYFLFNAALTIESKLFVIFLRSKKEPVWFCFRRMKQLICRDIESRKVCPQLFKYIERLDKCHPVFEWDYDSIFATASLFLYSLLLSLNVSKVRTFACKYSTSAGICNYLSFEYRSHG